MDLFTKEGFASRLILLKLDPIHIVKMELENCPFFGKVVVCNWRRLEKLPRSYYLLFWAKHSKIMLKLHDYWFVDVFSCQFWNFQNCRSHLDVGSKNQLQPIHIQVHVCDLKKGLRFEPEVSRRRNQFKAKRKMLICKHLVHPFSCRIFEIVWR